MLAFPHLPRALQEGTGSGDTVGECECQGHTPLGRTGGCEAGGLSHCNTKQSPGATWPQLRGDGDGWNWSLSPPVPVLSPRGSEGLHGPCPRWGVGVQRSPALWLFFFVFFCLYDF